MRTLLLLLPLLLLACQTAPPVQKQEIVTSLRTGAGPEDLVALVDDRDLGFALSYENLTGLRKAGAPVSFLDWLVQREIDRRAWRRARAYGPTPYGYPWRYGYGPWRYHGHARWWW